MAKKKKAKKKATKKKVAKKKVTKKKVVKKKATKAKKAKKVKKTKAKKVKKKVVKKKVTKKKVTKKKVVKKKVKKSKKAKKIKKAKAKKVKKKIAKKKVAKKKVTKKKVVKKKAKKAKKAKKKITKKKVVKKKASKSKKTVKKGKKGAKAAITSEKSPLEKEIEGKVLDRVSDLNQEFTLKEIFSSLKSLDLFQEESDECQEKKCENPASTSAYCRFHYIKNWKEIKKKIKILEEGSLQEFFEGLIEKYSLGHVETILSDLADEKSFFSVLEDMDIDVEDEVFDDVDEEATGDDEQDIAFETKVGNKLVYDD